VSYFMAVLIVRITKVTKHSNAFLMIQNRERSYILQSSPGNTRVANPNRHGRHVKCKQTIVTNYIT